MRIKKKTLSNLIKESLNLKENSQKKGSMVKTSRGESVPWGSPEHIDDLQNSLNFLVRMRNNQKRGSKQRYVYSRAVAETRSQLRSAKRYGIKMGMIEQDL